MAKLYNGYMGAVVGKLGTAVGFIWKGRQVLRAYVKHINYPNTEMQQAERDWFVGMVRFAAAVRPALLVGLRALAAREQMTEGNVFVKRNKQCFDRQGRGCDYGGMVLSAGRVAPVNALSREVDAEGVLTVEFERRSHMSRERSDDSVYLFIYNVTVRRGMLTAAVRRGSGRVAVALPDGWGGGELHCWLLAVDAKGEASMSTYVSPNLMHVDAVEVPLSAEAEEGQGVVFQEDTAGAAEKGADMVVDADDGPPL